MLAWGFGFWMWRLTLAHGVLFLLSAEYIVLCGVWPGMLVTWLLLHLRMIYSCALWLWSQIWVTCRSCQFLDLVTLSCAGARFLVPKGWLLAYEMVMEYFAKLNLSVVVAKCWFWGFVVKDKTFMCSVFTRLNFLLFACINGCWTGWGCPCLAPACGWFEWPSSGVVGFYDDDPSGSCSIWLNKCLGCNQLVVGQHMHVVEYFASWWLMFLT